MSPSRVLGRSSRVERRGRRVLGHRDRVVVDAARERRVETAALDRQRREVGIRVVGGLRRRVDAVHAAYVARAVALEAHRDDRDPLPVLVEHVAPRLVALVAVLAGDAGDDGCRDLVVLHVPRVGPLRAGDALVLEQHVVDVDAERAPAVAAEVAHPEVVLRERRIDDHVVLEVRVGRHLPVAVALAEPHADRGLVGSVVLVGLAVVVVERRQCVDRRLGDPLLLLVLEDERLRLRRVGLDEVHVDRVPRVVEAVVRLEGERRRGGIRALQPEAHRGHAVEVLAVVDAHEALGDVGLEGRRVAHDDVVAHRGVGRAHAHEHSRDVGRVDVGAVELGRQQHRAVAERHPVGVLGAVVDGHLGSPAFETLAGLVSGNKSESEMLFIFVRPDAAPFVPPGLRARRRAPGR